MPLQERATGPVAIRRTARRRISHLLFLPLLLSAPLAYSYNTSLAPRGIEPANRKPAIVGTPATAAHIDAEYKFIPGVYDREGDRLTFSVYGKPYWATFDSSTGRLTGTPNRTAAGRDFENIVVAVSDGKTTNWLAPFSVIVNDPLVVGSATLHWQPPTKMTNGRPLMDLSGYRVRYGTSTQKMNKVLVVPDGSATSVVVPGLVAGRWYFTLSALTRKGSESGPSNVVSKVIS